MDKKLSGKESRELAKQAVITKCRGKINAEPAVSLFKIKPWISVPKKICDNPINNYICGNLWIKRVGGREMLKASGGNVKCLGNGEKS